MIDWSKVRFAECRVCGALLGESHLAPRNHDLCPRCNEKCKLWMYRRCGWRGFKVVRDRTAITSRYCITEAQVNDPKTVVFNFDGKVKPFVVGDHVEVCGNPEFYRLPEEIAVTEWVARRLDRMAKDATRTEVRKKLVRRVG